MADSKFTFLAGTLIRSAISGAGEPVIKDWPRYQGVNRGWLSGWLISVNPTMNSGLSRRLFTFGEGTEHS
jgi:hypothetical protein